MIRTLLATTALTALIATTGAYAQSTPAPAPATTDSAAPAAAPMVTDGYIASNLMGENVYNGTGDDAQNVGEVNDLVIGANGTIEQIIVGVGGFLGIGEKNVALPYSEIDWAERDNDRWIVVSATADQLKELPAFDRAAYGPANAAGAGTASDTTAPASGTMAAAPTGTDTASGTTATQPAATTSDTPPPASATPAPAESTAAAPADNSSTMAAAPAGTAATTDQTAAIDKSTLKPLDTATIKSDDFVGTAVYGMNDERIGEIGDIVMQGDKVDAFLVDVGGFLGMGEKQVAVGMDNLQFLTDEDGDNYLYTKLSKESLEAQPAYDEAGYAQGRDQMRMVVPN